MDISVEDAFQYILTAGGVMPGAECKSRFSKNQEVLKEKNGKSYNKKKIWILLKTSKILKGKIN